MKTNIRKSILVAVAVIVCTMSMLSGCNKSTTAITPEEKVKSENAG